MNLNLAEYIRDISLLGLSISRLGLFFRLNHLSRLILRVSLHMTK
jgi:hypothetical protein